MGTKEGGLPNAPFLELFEKLVVKQSKNTSKGSPPKFVKWIEDVLVVALPPEDKIQVALLLEEWALIGKFIGHWPSPKTTEN